MNRNKKPSQSLQIANMLYTHTAINGGLSIDNNFSSPISGYMISIKNGPTFQNISTTCAHIITSWVLKNRLKNNEFYGGWLDKKTGKTYFTISINLLHKKEAITLAKKHNQIAIFDCFNEKEIFI